MVINQLQGSRQAVVKLLLDSQQADVRLSKNMICHLLLSLWY